MQRPCPYTFVNRKPYVNHTPANRLVNPEYNSTQHFSLHFVAYKCIIYVWVPIVFPCPTEHITHVDAILLYAVAVFRGRATGALLDFFFLSTVMFCSRCVILFSRYLCSNFLFLFFLNKIFFCISVNYRSDTS